MEFLTSLSDINYVLEFFIAVLIFCFPLEKRKGAVMYGITGLLVLLVEGFWVGPWLEQAGIHLWFFIVFLTLFVICILCCKIRIPEVLYCISCGYLTQHLSSSIFLFLIQIGVLNTSAAVIRLVYFGIILFVYTMAYFLFSRGISVDGHVDITRQSSLLLMVATVMIVYLLSVLSKQLETIMNVDTHNPSYQMMLGICQIYAIFTCFLLLFVQRLHMKEFQAWKALEKSRSIWEQRKQQYQFSKENMDLMNRKFHDMKHQLAALTQTDGNIQKDAYINEMQDILQVYGLSVETGNEALDVILMEKGLYCSMHRIEWNCVADGSFLSFMDMLDLYTLMGNALDNAIENAEKLGEDSDRFVSVTVRRERSFGLITIKNTMSGELKFRNGLPQTSKEDAANHGYGMQSIREITEKYHGSMTISAENKLYSLVILIPLREEEGNGN